MARTDFTVEQVSEHQHKGRGPDQAEDKPHMAVERDDIEAPVVVVIGVMHACMPNVHVAS